jgi:ketosteroid isomerase-like protein
MIPPRLRSIVLVALLATLWGGSVAAQSRVESFDSFLNTMDAAQRGLQRGDARAYKELWSHSDDVTLSGGFGGEIEKGWDKVSTRLDWAAKQFSNGSNRISRLVKTASGDLAYVVQSEHIEFVGPRGAASKKDYRVTMVFRKEHGTWKILHRQADANLIKEAEH